MSGTLVASSGEAPGINQLHIVGDRGMLQFDGATLTTALTDVSVGEHCASTDDMFGMPEFQKSKVEVSQEAGQHASVIQNFVNAALGLDELATPIEEGIASVELANALLLSAWQQRRVDLPIAAEEYEIDLQRRIGQTKLRTPTDRKVNIDMRSSYR